MQRFENSSIKSMLIDNSWYPSSGKIGVSTLTFGNWLQIEAEYQLKNSSSGNFIVDIEDSLGIDNQTTCLEQYDYVTKHERGRRVYGLAYSNRSAWVCDSLHGDTEGVALSKPRKRWKPAGESWPSMLSKDIVFYTRAINDNNLYLTVAVRYENIPIGTPVADISLKLYNPPNPNLYSEYEIPNQSDYINVTLSPVNTIYGTNIFLYIPSQKTSNR